MNKQRVIALTIALAFSALVWGTATAANAIIYASWGQLKCHYAPEYCGGGGDSTNTNTPPPPPPPPPK